MMGPKEQDPMPKRLIESCVAVRSDLSMGLHGGIAPESSIRMQCVLTQGG